MKEVLWDAGVIYLSTRSDFLNNERAFEVEYLCKADK